MDIISLNTQVDRLQEEGALFDLFKATIKNFYNGSELKEYIVPVEEEMRIDLIMKSMYDLEFSMISDYYGEIDVLLIINNIDNPLNIKRDQVLYYPKLNDLSTYRITEETDLSVGSNGALRAISYPSKKTRVDGSRSSYNQSGLALPPTAKGKPRDAASFKNGNYSIGGL